MVEIFDLLTPGRLIVRRTNGEVYMDSADRTWVRLGTRSYNNVAVNFPKFSSEWRSDYHQSGNNLHQDWAIGTQTKTFQIVLGAIGTATPNWMLVNAYGYRKDPADYEVFYHLYKSTQFPEKQWSTLNGGSLWVEDGRSTDVGDAPFMQRILTVEPEGSNFVLTCKQSSRAAAYNDLPVRGSDTSSEFIFSFNLTWGVFDL